MKYFKLPDLGEGLQEAEIVRWHVKVGDTVKADQLLVSVETAKALVDIPAPYDGVVAKTFGGEGDILHVGSRCSVTKAKRMRAPWSDGLRAAARIRRMPFYRHRAFDPRIHGEPRHASSASIGATTGR